MRFLPVAIITVAAFGTVFGYPNRDYQRDVPEDQEQQATSGQQTRQLYNDDDSDMYMEEIHNDKKQSPVIDGEAQSQTFYPSFSSFHDPPLGHSRPFFFQQEGAYSHRPIGYQGQQFGYDSSPRFSGYKGEASQKSTSESQDLLGSGNFGVISGGTFYNDNDGDHLGYEDRYNPYFYNGHGRPAYHRGNPRPTKHEQFANFRDFADINTPSSPAYSNFVVVYANGNGTVHHTDKNNRPHRPRNIIEHLAMLDEENVADKLTTEAPKKKLSKSKRKLALLPPHKKPYNAKKSKTLPTKDLYEPLLALS